MDRAGLILALAAFSVISSPAAAAEHEPDEDAEIENLITAAFTPVNVGRFTFRDDEGLAYEPNLRLATGLSAEYHRIVAPHLTVGISLRYLHTLTEYSGEAAWQGADISDEGVSGYADVLRPGLELGGLWSPAEENLDFGATVTLGPSFVWFDDLKMAGLHGAAAGSATLWLTSWLGLHVAIGLTIDGVWTTDASGWAADSLDDSSAYTVFLNLDIGLRARF